MNWLIQTAQAAGDVVAESGLRAIDAFTWAWVVGISALGGIVSFHQKVQAGQARAYNFTELLGELCGSAFVGILTFLLCRATGLNDIWAAALCGVTGHMGTRAMMLFEKILERKLTT